ncbi:S-adenosyl-L-methionine-dependent methyltransferase [Polychaeton citri CBS 116435]|uniref:S-adenosyl-L-methionine-dependent methyltransferase n=1 Tax=Polychaeton citri CBS 116435 TaxID=1314669 RepID=A0A9P4UPR0_9PEZI|nr:S-adenosyl-L-methionine-dependent methyltransferase [Polychaeton citri CBS 116435]
MQGSAQYEQEHVHDVYEQIASHFSSTRYKPWPIIERFLQTLPAGAVGIDVGCGNGKYLAVNKDIFIVGSDRSTNLTKIATQHRQHAAIVADILELPHPVAKFDFAISIAVIHHLATPERRVQAIASILDTLIHEGQALLYCWALEQENSRRGWSEKDDQDVMVPWVMRTKKQSTDDSRRVDSGDKTFHRYYHLYRKGELERDVQAAGGTVVEAGYEKDNWWAIARRAPVEHNAK